MDDPTARILNWIPIVISITLLIAGEIYGGDVAYIASVLCAMLLLYYGSVYVRETEGRTRYLMNITYIVAVFALIVGCGCVFVSIMNLGDFPIGTAKDIVVIGNLPYVAVMCGYLVSKLRKGCRE